MGWGVAVRGQRHTQASQHPADGRTRKVSPESKEAAGGGPGGGAHSLEDPPAPRLLLAPVAQVNPEGHDRGPGPLCGQLPGFLRFWGGPGGAWDRAGCTEHVRLNQHSPLPPPTLHAEPAEASAPELGRDGHAAREDPEAGTGSRCSPSGDAPGVAFRGSQRPRDPRSRSALLWVQAGWQESPRTRGHAASEPVGLGSSGGGVARFLVPPRPQPRWHALRSRVSLRP